ncbi:MAG: AAA family ATPase [Actinomycetota bacterium]|nr:AAA family ATPase [Actinomycetota bacterium]
MTTDNYLTKVAGDGVAVDDLLRAADDSLSLGHGLAQPLALGLPVLDVHIGHGLVPGDLAVLAGAQGVGKTTLALQVARNVAAAGSPATYVCFEHDAEQLVERLLVMEANLVVGDAAPTLQDVRERLSHSGAQSLKARVRDLPGMVAAMDRVRDYGSQLHIVSARGDVTGLPEIRVAAAWHDRLGLVVVDYLQKVRSDQVDEDQRVARIATSLKDFALETGQAVLAVSALDRAGLEAKRIRARHLKGSVTLAYEADLILLMHHKYDVVAREKLVYDLARAQDLHHWLVVSLEKNRHGDDRLDLAFRKRLSRGHIDPHGHIEDDALVDERIHIDH